MIALDREGTVLRTHAGRSDPPSRSDPRRDYGKTQTDPEDAVRRISLAVAGPTGKVGRALLHAIEERKEWLSRRRGIELRIVGVINTKKMAWDESGFPPNDVLTQLGAGEQAQWDTFAAHMLGHRDGLLIFLDCTASTDVARGYPSLLKGGVAVVTPNKAANTLEYPFYQKLRRLGRQGGRRYLYETTVGAATPILRTLDDLRRAGDRVRKIEGALSGTLSYVLHCVNGGVRFSAAVREAYRLGLTEPHPASDLSGEDVARKLLILVREAGYRIERADITVKGLVPAEIDTTGDPEEFLQALSGCDGEWTERVAHASREGTCLAYVASFDGNDASVGLAAIPLESIFVRLAPSENAVRYYTDLHWPLPLTIQGIGAGPEVTARGVLADVVHTALGAAA